MALLSDTTAECKYSGGTGEPNDPYRIATPQDLNDIGNHQDDCNKYFVLVNDFNLAEYTGTQFNRIGTEALPFSGVFDGNDRKIWNFTWNSNGISYIGLFGYLGIGGQVKNLGMENVDVTVTNGWYVGGLIGYNEGTITNCHATGSVSGVAFTGGLVGYHVGGGIINCYSTGSVGGEVGDVKGGLVGYAKNSEIINSYSTCSVSTGGKCVGGLVGLNSGGTITNSYSSGTVSSTNFAVGGLLGINQENGTVSSCYSTGRVLGGIGKTGPIAGGLVGTMLYGMITASFWDIETSGLNKSAGGTGKTTAEMKTMSTFINAGWDFVNIWDICEGTNYPRLRWQIPLSISMGDFVCPYGVDFMDFAVIASAWLSKPGEPDWNATCDISQPKDNFINELDWAVLCENWLEEM